MSEWISVEDRLPDNRDIVQIYCSYGKQATAKYCGQELFLDWMRPQHSYGSVTHWSILPEPPK